MPNAKIDRPDGTHISVDGSVDEIERIMRLFSSPAPGMGQEPSRKPRQHSEEKDDDEVGSEVGPSISAIVAKIKDCDEAVAIEHRVLNSKSLLNRVLLPLYILEKYFPGSEGLTSGDINKITTQLRVPIKTPHASTTLSQTARPYVVGDTVRKKGSVVRYRLIRRGVQYFEALLSGQDA